jgi:predicted dehydrogenase
VVGTRGEVLVEPAYDYSIPLGLTLTVGEHSKKERHGRRDQFAPEIIYFSRCLLEDREPEPSGEEGIEDVRIMNAIHESARTGMAVQLPDSWRERRPEPSQEIHKPPVREPETIHAPSPSVE